jgi:hypothetical protein
VVKVSLLVVGWSNDATFFLQGTLNIMVGLILLALASTKLGALLGLMKYTFVFHKIRPKSHKFVKA